MTIGHRPHHPARWNKGKLALGTFGNFPAVGSTRLLSCDIGKIQEHGIGHAWFYSFHQGLGPGKIGHIRITGTVHHHLGPNGRQALLGGDPSSQNIPPTNKFLGNQTSKHMISRNLSRAYVLFGGDGRQLRLAKHGCCAKRAPNAHSRPNREAWKSSPCRLNRQPSRLHVGRNTAFDGLVNHEMESCYASAEYFDRTGSKLKLTHGLSRTNPKPPAFIEFAGVNGAHTVASVSACAVGL